MVHFDVIWFSYKQMNWEELTKSFIVFIENVVSLALSYINTYGQIFWILSIGIEYQDTNKLIGNKFE